VTTALISATGYRYLRGWNDVSARVTKSIETNPKRIKVEVREADVRIRQVGSLAWAEYDSILKFEDGEEKSHEYRTLVKEGNAWKIVSQIHVASESFNQGLEGALNSAGYLLLTSGKIKEAIELFTMNVRMFPKSWNAYDSLGEAHAVAGQKDLAIENYSKSLELNPNNLSGKAAMAKLKDDK
jgi:tetratricopeptide (TPR) repeat protein